MDDTPIVPTGEPTPASIATPTNSNEQPAPFAPPPANDTPPVNQPTEPTPEQIAKYLGTTPENLEKAKKFYENNGGFDRVFGERKVEITTPKSQQPPTTPANAQPQQPQQPQPQQQQQIEGGLNPQDVIAKAYFMDLANNEKYANIASEIKSGEIFDEFKKMGIVPMVNGQFNDGQIRNFLDMYSKTKPAAPAQTPMTNTPTVQPKGETFTGPIQSTQDAIKVIQEHNAMVASGQGEHSKYKEAAQFLAQGFDSRHPGQKPFQGWNPQQKQQ